MSELDDEVVARARRGDPAAVEETLRAVRLIAVRYCRSRLGRVDGSYATADDVAQEVCLAVFHGLPRVRGPLVSYVYGVVTHKVADTLRAATRAKPWHPVEFLADQPDPGPGPEEAALAADQSAQLTRLLTVLPAQQREIIILRIMVGLSAEQVGTALGMKAGNVRLIQHRALARLRDMAGQHVASEVNP